MQVEDDRAVRRDVEERRRFLELALARLVPSAHLAAGFALGVAFDGAKHEVIIIGRDIDRQAQVGDHSVDLVGSLKSGGPKPSNRPTNLNFRSIGSCQWTRTGQRVRDSSRPEGVVVFHGPVARQLSTQRQNACACPGPEKGRALLVLDGEEKTFPVSIVPGVRGKRLNRQGLRHDDSASKPRSR